MPLSAWVTQATFHLCFFYGVSSNYTYPKALYSTLSNNGPISLLLRIGCILLSVGQDEFRGEALHTLNYVVNQSDFTVQTLRNVTGYLSLAKTVNVAQLFLPSDIKDDIDKLNVDLNTAAETLWEKTDENSIKIRRVFDAVYDLVDFINSSFSWSSVCYNLLS